MYSWLRMLAEPGGPQPLCCVPQVAKYLSSQFYALNYSLRQRMDMLDVSARAVQADAVLSSRVTAATSCSLVFQDADPPWSAGVGWHSTRC